MEYSPLVVFVLCLSSVRSSPTQADAHQQDIDLHHHHVSYIAEFPCIHPPKRVIRVKDILPADVTHGKAYFPDITVLHHCDDGCGSCTSQHSCRVEHSVVIPLIFKVTFLEDVGPHTKGSWDWEHHDVYNHTVCACRPWKSVDAGTQHGHYRAAGADDDWGSSGSLGNRFGAANETVVEATTTVKPEENKLVFPS